MKRLEDFKVALVGSTGAVGREVIKTLIQRAPKPLLKNLQLYASPRSEGMKIQEEDYSWTVKGISDSVEFSGLDIVFFTAGSKVAEKYAPKAAAAGALVIDNSSLYRMQKNVPLVVPEVNGETLELAVSEKGCRIVANPNCTTAQMVMALKPLHDQFQIKRVILSSYQAVSGKGQQGIDEFHLQLVERAEKKPLTVKAFPYAISFNCIPHIDVFQEDGFTGEEQKVMNETRKIMGDESMRVVATCVRVPVMNCHSESVNIETTKPITVAAAKEALLKMPGVKLVDDPKSNLYPVATMVDGKDDVYVGRLRKDPSCENGLGLWIVGDNLRKGAALNAVQIMEEAARRGIL